MRGTGVGLAAFLVGASAAGCGVGMLGAGAPPAGADGAATSAHPDAAASGPVVSRPAPDASAGNHDVGAATRDAGAASADAAIVTASETPAQVVPLDPNLPSGLCPAPPPGLRLVAPISGSTVTTARPRLAWVADAGANTDVQVCADRPCSQVIWQTTTAATQAAPDADLPPGYWFWRARSAAQPDASWTAPWLFRVRRRAAGYAPLANTAVEPFADYNGDGYPDTVLGPTTDSPLVWILLGGPEGASADRAIPFGNYSGLGVDLNGDGFSDLVVPQQFMTAQGPGWNGLVELGGPQGLSPAGSITVALPPYPLPAGSPIGVGDVDGDGFGDLVWPLRYNAFLFHGCAGGPAPGPWQAVPSEQGGTTPTSGDLNGDGLADFVYGGSPGFYAYLGGAGLLRSAMLYPAVGPQALVVDLNYDGYSDVIGPTYISPSVFEAVLLGGSAGIAPTGTVLSSWPVAFGDFDGDGIWDALIEPACFDDSCSPVSYEIAYGAPGPWGTSFSRVVSAPFGIVADLNADGYDDLIAPGANGQVAYYAGSPAGLPATPTSSFQL
jgi:hypothetical protein